MAPPSIAISSAAALALLLLTGCAASPSAPEEPGPSAETSTSEAEPACPDGLIDYVAEFKYNNDPALEVLEADPADLEPAPSIGELFADGCVFHVVGTAEGSVFDDWWVVASGLSIDDAHEALSADGYVQPFPDLPYQWELAIDVDHEWRGTVTTIGKGEGLGIGGLDQVGDGTAVVVLIEYY